MDCPRARSDMTPCILRDGDLARADDGCCVGCGIKEPPELRADTAPSQAALDLAQRIREVTHWNMWEKEKWGKEIDRFAASRLSRAEAVIAKLTMYLAAGLGTRTEEWAKVMRALAAYRSDTPAEKC